MTGLTRRAMILSALATPMASAVQGADQPYRVRDPLAGYFDIDARREMMRALPDETLVQARLKAMRTAPCADIMEIPVQSQTITIPSFYGDNDNWRKAVTPFRQFEDAVSGLAAQNLVARDRRYSDCLIDLLLKWADENALARFNFSSSYKQGWFQVESTLFAIGHALAAIRPDVQDRPEELARIDAWLLGVARSHFAIPGAPNGTCCNNHYYRRALYAAIIGVVTGDDALFDGGVRAVRAALEEATPEGALPLEMKRGELAAHYQNYAVMYLAMIAEIAERQGYPLWELEVDGQSLHTLIAFNNRIMADPNFVTAYSGADEVSLRYRDDMQYFAWYEIYLSRFHNQQMEDWIAPNRPMYNRSLGGHLTMYFYSYG